MDYLPCYNNNAKFFYKYSVWTIKKLLADFCPTWMRILTIEPSINSSVQPKKDSCRKFITAFTILCLNVSVFAQSSRCRNCVLCSFDSLLTIFLKIKVVLK